MEEPYYEEFCGSIYLRKGKEILRMVDGTDEIALAFEREGLNLIRQGSPFTISEYVRDFEAVFPGFLASITLPKGFPLSELNEVLRTRNVHALITKNCPEALVSITPPRDSESDQ
jgi:hypothetical protein